MTKAKYLKYLIGVSLFIIILFIGSYTVNATVLDNQNIGTSTNKLSADGSIALKLTGLTLDITHTYSYSLVKAAATEPTKWMDLIDLTETTANCILSATTKEIKEVLKVANTGYLYIKDTTEDANIVEKLPVNLKLPYSEAIDISYSVDHKVSYNRLYDINNATYQFVEIEDESIINAYLNGGKDISAIEDMLPTEPPTNGWKNMTKHSSSPYAYAYENKESDEGLHLLWAQIYGDGCRTIYGYTLYDNLPIDETAPTVEKIYVDSPEEGTYTTGQAVTIKVYFSEAITGSSVPTLSIKFGESTDRELINGTIVNLTEVNGTFRQHYIEYSYNIQESDEGQLAAIDYTGGDIKDKAGNQAILSCPVITGNAIKANIETTPTPTPTPTPTTTPTVTPTPTPTPSKDATTAPNKIPNAGKGAVASIFVVVILVGVISFIKVKKYKQV